MEAAWACGLSTGLGVREAWVLGLPAPVITVIFRHNIQQPLCSSVRCWEGLRHPEDPCGPAGLRFQ